MTTHTKTTKTTKTTKRRGLTLIEIMLVVSVAGIVMGIGFPKADRLRRQMELDTAANRFAQELKAAQHEAVRRNQAVVVTMVGDNAYRVGTRTIRLPEGITFHSSSPSTITFAPFGPATVTGSGRFSIKYADDARTDIQVSTAGMVTVARHDEPVVTEPTEPVVSEEPYVLEPVIEPVIGIVEPTTETLLDPVTQ